MKQQSGKDAGGLSPDAAIEARIASLGDWRGRTLARIRALIWQADPDVVEEWKWVKPSSPGIPVWSHDGMICTGEVYKDKVKMTFAYGASLEDPAGLFNSSLEGNVRRAIDFGEHDAIDEKALLALLREAVAWNTSRRAAKGKPRAGAAGSAGGAKAAPRQAKSKARGANAKARPTAKDTPTARKPPPRSKGRSLR